jgi:hypothetical protein
MSNNANRGYDTDEKDPVFVKVFPKAAAKQDTVGL